MHRTAYALLIATTLLWAGNAIAGKLAIGHISPMVLTAARWTFAAAILLMIGWRNIRADWATIRRNGPMLFLLGATGFAVFNAALYVALTHTSAINVSIEQSGVPMLIFLLNFLFFHQRASRMQIAGLILTIGGVILTASHGDFGRLLRLDLNFGDLIMLVAAIIYAVYSVLLRFKPKLHWQSLMFALCLAASVASIPFVLAESRAGATILPDASGWITIAYVVIGPSIMAQMFYIRAIELIGANRAGLFINLVPIFGTLLSILLLGERFQLYHAVALTLVFSGIALAERSERRR